MITSNSWKYAGLMQGGSGGNVRIELNRTNRTAAQHERQQRHCGLVYREVSITNKDLTDKRPCPVACCTTASTITQPPPAAGKLPESGAFITEEESRQRTSTTTNV